MKLTDDQKSEIGDRLAQIFRLEPTMEFGMKRERHYRLGEGFHRKTALGVYEVVANVMRDAGQMSKEES